MEEKLEQNADFEEEFEKISIPTMIFQRFIEILLSCGVLSAIVTAINMNAIVYKVESMMILLALMAIVFYIFTYIMQRNLYTEVYPNQKQYYSSVIAYLIFVALGFIVRSIHYKSFVWVFLITKSFSFIYFVKIPEIVSIIVFHIIGLLIMIFARVGMDKIFIAVEEEINREEEIRREEIENSSTNI